MSITDTSPTSGPQRLRARLSRVPKTAWAIAGALAVYALFAHGILVQAGSTPRFRFDPTPLTSASLVIQIHVVAAVLTFAIGLVLLSARKGFRLHRTLGWTWVITMAVTAGSSLFITAIFTTHYSPIHALSAWTLLGLPMGIAAIRRRDIARHRARMTGMFVGGMVIAGLFSLLPGRLLWHVFFAG